MEETEKVWTEEYVKELPDSCFACVTDKERYLPHHAKDGTLDESHLMNAIARVQLADMTASNQAKAWEHLITHADALFNKRNEQEDETNMADEKENKGTKEKEKPKEPKVEPEKPEASEGKTESIDSKESKSLRNKLTDSEEQQTALEARIEELEADKDDLKAKLNKPVTSNAEPDHGDENVGIRALKILMKGKGY